MSTTQELVIGFIALTTALLAGLHQVYSLKAKLQERNETLASFNEFCFRNSGTCIAFSPHGKRLLSKLIEAEIELCNELMRQQFWFMNESEKLRRIAPLLAILNDTPPTTPASHPTPSMGFLFLKYEIAEVRL
jgi:hypothetical protein